MGRAFGLHHRERGRSDENAANIEKIDPWLQVLWDHKGSDLLLATGSQPRTRVDGGLTPLPGTSILTGEEIDEIVRDMLSPEQEATFNEHQDVDFSMSWRDLARLRGSAFTQMGDTALALRMIPSEIPTFEELGLPPVAEWMARLPRGSRLAHRPDGFRKIDDAGVHHRPDQSDAIGTHPHHRGPY